MVALNNPDLTSIQERILTELYETNYVKIFLKVYSKEDEFGVSLKVKSEDVNVEFDTRVAIEKHHDEHKHNEIHIQGDIKKTTLEFFKNGELHIFLDVADKKQLVTACEGFTFAIVDILLIVEEKLGYQKNKLIEHFFAEDIDEFKPNKKVLHKLMYDALKSNYIEKISIIFWRF